jgi:hypothetical protein
VVELECLEILNTATLEVVQVLAAFLLVVVEAEAEETASRVLQVQQLEVVAEAELVHQAQENLVARMEEQVTLQELQVESGTHVLTGNHLSSLVLLAAAVERVVLATLVLQAVEAVAEQELQI